MGRYRKPAQRSLTSPEVTLMRRPLAPTSFEVRFRTVCDQLLPDTLFDDLYVD